MAKEEKYIWTLNKIVVNEYGDTTYASERAFEVLYDALKAIGIWSNMKTNIEGRKVTIEKDDIADNEITFVAIKRNEHGFAMEAEKMILGLVPLKLKDEDSQK